MKKQRGNPTKKRILGHKIKAAVIGIISFILIIFITVATIAYHRGVFDISFIKRPGLISDTTTNQASSDTGGSPSPIKPSEPLTPIPDKADTPSDSDKLSYEQIPNIHSDKELINNYLSSLENTTVLTENGYRITDLEYDNSYVISKLTTQLDVGSEYSLREQTVQVPVRIPDEKYPNYYTTVFEDAQTDRPAVDIYMDYIIIDNGETCKLTKNDGTILAEDFDVEKYVPAYTRDKNDIPLFKSEEQSKYNPRNTITRYYYVNKNGEFKTSDYDDKADSRGLYFNYPSYFGKSDSSFRVYYDEELELYAYGTADGVASKDDYKYSAAFNHSEGICAAVETDGLMYFLNRNNITLISASKEFFKKYNESQRRLLANYIMPDTFGEESRGFFYFDHGLCRVRKQVIDAYHWQTYEDRRVTSDDDILICYDGTEFPIPTGYNLISYSNGVLLLEKDGLYGYMDHTGGWIAEPVYTYARPFNEGLAAVGNDGKIGMIDTNGNIVIPQVFDHISDASGGLIALYDGECGWTVLNKLVPSQDNA